MSGSRVARPCVGFVKNLPCVALWGGIEDGAARASITAWAKALVNIVLW